MVSVHDYQTVAFFGLVALFAVLERLRPAREVDRWKDLKIDVLSFALAVALNRAFRRFWKGRSTGWARGGGRGGVARPGGPGGEDDRDEGHGAEEQNHPAEGRDHGEGVPRRAVLTRQRGAVDAPRQAA